MQISEQDFVQFLTIKKKLAPKTIDTYRTRYLVINRWLRKTNQTLSEQVVENFLYEKKEIEKLSNAAVNTYIQTLRHIDSYCKNRGLPFGFTHEIESLPKTQPEINPLTPQEIEKLLLTGLTYKNRNAVNCSSLDRNYLTLTAFLAITGCRFEEAASLMVKRLDIENGRALLVNTKNKHNRYVFFEGSIKQSLEILTKGKNEDDLVFTNSKGQHMHPGDFNENLRARALKAGITKRVHAHLLRHSYATQLYKATHDITLVATILGHRDIKTTNDTYVHLDTDYLQHAIQRHPLIRKYIEPIEVIKGLKTAIEAFNLESDKRFRYSIQQSESGLILSLEAVRR